MSRFVLALLLSIGMVAAACADVLELLKQGLAARYRGDDDAAIYYLGEAIAAGGLTPQIRAAALASRGVAYENKGEIDRAVADFDAALDLSPGSGSVHIYRGLAWVKKRDLDRAIADFTAAARDAEHGYLALMNRANVYQIKGDNVQAIEDYTRAIRLMPGDARSYYGRGNSYLALDETDKAITSFGAAILLQPNFIPAYVNRGAAYLGKGEIGTAITDFNAAIQLDASDATLFTNRGIAYITIGAYGPAITDFDNAIRLNPNNAFGFANRGIARFYFSQTDAAIEDLMTAVRLRPSDANLIIWLHLLRARAGQNDLPDLSSRVVNVDRIKWPSPVINLHLGVVGTDIVRDAAPLGTTEMAQRRRNCEINFHLGMFHLEQSVPNEARGNLQSAMTLCLPGAIEFAAAKAELARIEQMR